MFDECNEAAATAIVRLLSDLHRRVLDTAAAVASAPDEAERRRVQAALRGLIVEQADLLQAVSRFIGTHKNSAVIKAAERVSR